MKNNIFSSPASRLSGKGQITVPKSVITGDNDFHTKEIRSVLTVYRPAGFLHDFV